MKTYQKITIRPRHIRKYPFQAKMITFVMAGGHYMGAVESLVMYMGYNANQYTVVDCVACDKNGNPLPVESRVSKTIEYTKKTYPAAFKALPDGWRFLEFGEKIKCNDKFSLFGWGSWFHIGKNNCYANKPYDKEFFPIIRRIVKKKAKS